MIYNIKESMKNKRIFVCSPYKGDIENNLIIAKKLCQKVIAEDNFPFAPHLHYTNIFNEDVLVEREKGIQCGLEFLKICDEMLVFVGNGISEGMQIEIDYAKKINKPIYEIENI